MRTATSKHLSVVQGLAKFAQVTVRRGGHLGPEEDLRQPQILLSGNLVPTSDDSHREIIEAAQRGVRETEAELGWQGPQHFVVKIEGLEVDGVDAKAAFVAAANATKELIQT